MYDSYIPGLRRRVLLRRFVVLAMMVLLMVAAMPVTAFAQETPVTQGEETLEDVALAVDTMWVIVAAMLVLFMQAGFAMLEVGFSRMKNVGSVVAKILAMMGIGFVAFWAAGFAFAFSEGGGLQSIIGTQGFFLTGPEHAYAGLAWTAVPLSAKFLFQVAFAGSVLLGPRIGKHDDAGNPRTIPCHNMTLAVLGVIILWIGWCGFNPG